MIRIIKRPAAKQDLIEQADFIAQDNLEAALRFLDAAFCVNLRHLRISNGSSADYADYAELQDQRLRLGSMRLILPSLQ
jgi:hypothetical protein